MSFPGLFEKLFAQCISYIEFAVIRRVSWPLFIFVFLASIWPSGSQTVWQTCGFSNFWKKTIYSVHFIPSMSRYGVSLLTSIQNGGIMSPFMGTSCWILTHWGRDKMAVIFGTTFSNAFSFNENVWFSIKIPCWFVHKGQINNNPTLVQIMVLCRPGDKQWSELMIVFERIYVHSASMS